MENQSSRQPGLGKYKCRLPRLDLSWQWKSLLIVTRMRTLITGLLALSVGVSASPSKRSDSQPQAQVKNGTYQGVYSPEYDQDFFLGVPFAQPPVEDLRFQVPQPLNSTWEDTREVEGYSPLCVGYGVGLRKCRTMSLLIPSARPNIL